MKLRSIHSTKRAAAAFSIVAGSLMFAALGCSRFDPDGPFTLMGLAEGERTPIPEGTPIIEHEPVPIEGRTERIDLIEDLVIESGEEPFYRLHDVDADDEGNIFAFDGGNQNVVAFDRRGRYLRTIGRAGQGPGEIQLGGDIAIAGGLLVHVSRNRFNVWSVDGEVVHSRVIGFTNFFTDIEGTDGGTIVGFARKRGANPRHVVTRTDIEGYRAGEYADLPRFRQLMVVQGSYGRSTRIPQPRSALAVARSGEVYVTAGTEYEVLALNADATARWALQVAWERTEVTDERIDQALRHVMGLGEDNDIPSRITSISRSDIKWPERLPALMGGSTVHTHAVPLRVDGHGHLYVFPFIPDAWDRPDQPVDVYSPDGEHLFSGMIPMFRWDAARGDFVYGVGTSPDTEEYRVVRYRLVEPFE